MITKYIKTVLAFFLLTQTVFAQKFDSPKKGSAIGLSINLVDFENRDKVDPGFSLMYWKGITKHLDFSLRYNGLFSDYAMTNSTNSGYISELETSLHLRALSDDHVLNPFLSAGWGFGHYGKWDVGRNGSYDGKINWATYVPVGGGLQLNMNSKSYLLLQANYRWSPTDAHLNNNMFYSLGFLKALKRKKPKTPPPPPDRDNDGVVDSLDACPDVVGLVSLKGCPDRDGDGIADKDDKCPDVAGLAKYQGCPIPDTDKDGINDEEDKCPTVAGLAKYQGCPIPDTDKDGINDEEDKCPTIPGVVKYQGCPIPDTDKDGINDEEDRCPTIPGVASQQGCPEISEEVIKTVNFAAKNIYFAFASSKLLSKSFKHLDEVVKILNDKPGLKLKIDGHTDYVGSDEYNMKLSTNRAASVKAYIESKGISSDRLISEGFGESTPVADNKTAAGRTLNRRVEMKVFY
jgi:outer membrane protein OmpA-like peptidoglycan-associated protein